MVGNLRRIDLLSKNTSWNQKVCGTEIRSGANERTHLDLMLINKK